ncbi:MAG: helix-turn-helix transcriptional regulator [Agriterribacter sp.]
MSAQEPLVIHYTNDEAWLPQISTLLKATIDGNTLFFDNEIGKGNIYKISIDWGLRMRRMKVVFHQPVIFARDRIVQSEKGYYVLISNLGEQYLETTTADQHFKLGYTTDDGIYFSSPLLSASFSFKPGKHYHLIYIIITHERIKDFIRRQPQTQHDLLESIIDKNNPLYHVEYLDAPLLHMLREIDQNLYENRPNNLLLHSRALELCYQILNRVEKRNSKTAAKIHPDDIEKLNEVKKRLSEGYESACPPIEEVAKEIGMSPTKFKKLFKQMFGDSYYQFYKNVRMYKAKEMLQEHNMNVSEVGYRLGYNNLSKFSRAFKEKFHITPGKLTNN